MCALLKIIAYIQKSKVKGIELGVNEVFNTFSGKGKRVPKNTESLANRRLSNSVFSNQISEDIQVLTVEMLIT